MSSIEPIPFEKNEIGETNSIFQQPWWLEVVAPGQWGEVVVKRGEEVAARMPYVIKKKYGLTALTMPPLTQTLGPWLRPSKAKYARRISEQKQLMNELIEQLPEVDYFCQNFSPLSRIGCLLLGGFRTNHEIYI